MIENDFTERHELILGEKSFVRGIVFAHHMLSEDRSSSATTGLITLIENEVMKIDAILLHSTENEIQFFESDQTVVFPIGDFEEPVEELFFAFLFAEVSLESGQQFSIDTVFDLLKEFLFIVIGFGARVAALGLELIAGLHTGLITIQTGEIFGGMRR